MNELTSLRAIQAALRNETLTCTQLVTYYLGRIEETRDLNAYVEVYEEEAMQRAKELDQKFKDAPNKVGRLFGMVTAIKDVICYENHTVTAASAILEGFTSLFSATAVERLIEEDAIIIGRLNCDEFAMGSTNENSIYGPVHNAVNNKKVSGGSSGGSAVAVQAGTCLTALGTDTGGSVRQPAAFCGVIGLKPTYGRISRHGLIAYASSFDQIGVLGKEMEDIAIMLEVMAGKDDYDSTVSTQPVQNYTEELNFEGKAKIAYFKQALASESLDSDIKQQTLALLERLREQGHTVEAVDFEYLDYIIPAYYVLTMAEASSNLSRFDGIRYGYRSEAAKNLKDTYELSRTEGFGKEVKRRIMLGTFVLSAGYYDAYYRKAQQVRRLIYERTAQIFESYDFIVMPTTPSPAFDLGEKTKDPVAVYLADIYTVQANMAGIPAINIPLGNHTEGLPLGIQFMANKFDESRLMGFANYILKEKLVSI